MGFYPKRNVTAYHVHMFFALFYDRTPLISGSLAWKKEGGDYFHSQSGHYVKNQRFLSYVSVILGKPFHMDLLEYINAGK